MIPSSISIEQIHSVTGGELIVQHQAANMISQLLTDSRKVVNPELSLYITIKGDNHDGHEFIADLIKSGVHNFIISNKAAWSNDLEGNAILVDDPMLAMQQLAAWHRNKFHIPVIGITGSNGKTIVKEWLYQLLREDKNIVRSPKSYNSQVGVPLSVWQMTDENDLGIFEAGISRPGEMQRLEQIIHPSIGIFTNIGTAHDENFASREEKVREKMQLFNHCAAIIFCRDYADIHTAVNTLPATTVQFSWSRKVKADLQVARITKRESGTEIQGIYKNRFTEISIPFTDEASVENAIHCWAVMLLLEYSHEVIAKRMEMLSPVAMRLEMKEGINNCSVINDSYNSDIGSLTIALDFINQQKQFNRRTIILSDILQSGRGEEVLYKEVAALLTRKNVHRVIGIGEALQRQQEHFTMEKKFYRDTEEFLRDFSSVTFANEAVLIKGARAFGFERISKALQQKAHETVLEINLNAVVHNLNLFRSRVKPETKLMVMVKAFAYGSGSFEIANTMQFHRADYLAVAYADEGVALRKAGITLPVMVMNPEEQSFDAMIKHQLEPEIYNFRILNQFTDALRRHSPDAAVRFPVHLELETGMRRLGFEEKEINELIIRIKNNRYVRIASIFSHLVASDESQHDEFTRSQLNLFEKMSTAIKQHFNYPLLRHILNSAGILRFPEAQLDMVRLGIGLHGVAATVNEQRQLQMVATLKTTISQIKQVKTGESVGYSRKAIAAHDMTIATVGIGYADGYNRRLGNGIGKMLVMGQFAPVVGSVCMDMTMIDITGIPAREGTEVIVFGSDYSVLEVARQLDTIPYEILTSISERVKRVYFQE